MDYSIAMGVKPMQLDSPMNSLAQMLQIQQAQGANQLNAMKMDEYRQGNERKNQLMALAKGWTPDTTDDQRVTSLKGGGFFDEADKLTQALLKRKELEAGQTKTLGENLAKYTASQRDLAQSVLANPSPEGAVAYLTNMQNVSKALGLPFSLDHEFQFVQGKTPEQIKSWAYNHAVNAEKLLPKLVNFAAGDREVVGAQDPITGQFTQTAAPVINQSPDNKATVGASMANASATREMAQATRDAANIQTGFQNEQSLRKEFEGLPEIKNYKMAYPSYAAIKDAASRNTPQSDINIVYGLAKLYDPTSVVREGEYATVANSPNIPEKVKGYAQYIAGGGRLSPETKRQILAEASGRIGTYQTEAQKARSSYELMAKQRGINPSAVFPDMGDMGKPIKVVDFGSLK